MKFKAKDNLAPIRSQMVNLIKQNSSVIEFGCGNGDLLIQLSSKIKSGLGIDKSNAQIGFAIQQKRTMKLTNIDFLCEELDKSYNHSESYDYSVASLFFHVIPWSDSIGLINKMKGISDKILICGFSRPETLQQRSLLWLDQRFSSHYRNFEMYQKNGYLGGILRETHCLEFVTYDTPIPFVKIYNII